MAKIGISLNETIRDTLSQIIYVYDKYIDKTDLKSEEITDFDITNIFGFNTQKDLNNFLYLESPLEIFGHADLMSDGLMNKLNMFLINNSDDDEHDIEIVSREIDKSIPSTFFFLSKTGCKSDKIRFVKNHIDEWGENDILITANPIALKNKPDGKISVKILTSYNKDVDADYVLNNINEFFSDYQLQDKIYKNINNIIVTNFEEI